MSVRESECCPYGGGVSKSVDGGSHGSAHSSESDDGGSHGSAHRLRFGINAGALAENVGEYASLRREGVGVRAGVGSAQGSLVGVEQAEMKSGTGEGTETGTAFRFHLCC